MAALFHPPEGWSLPVEECAPTLAGLKCGTVFNLPLEGASLAHCLLWWDLRLVPRGVRLTVLRRRTGSALYGELARRLIPISEPPSGRFPDTPIPHPSEQRRGGPPRAASPLFFFSSPRLRRGA